MPNQKSTPKLVRVNADDSKALIYRNLGNGRRLPLFWGKSVTLASGTQEIVVSSGVEFHSYKVASGVIVATPTSDTGAVRYYIDKDSVNNVVSIKSTATVAADVGFDVMVFLGDEASFTNTDSNQIWK